MSKLDFTYRPNWNDPRVKKRVETVLTWVELSLSESADLPVPAQTLDSVFGPIGHKLGDYLRANLLIRSDMYKPGLRFYKYRLKKNSINKILSQQDNNSYFVNTSSRIKVLQDHFKEELSTLEFKLKEQSNRYWHPALNIKRELKQEFWKPYLPYDYDIEACAPTLLLQLAEKANLNKILAKPIKDYLEDKDRFRQHVSELTGLSKQQSKRILNSLFNGARLAKNSFCSTYRMMQDEFDSPIEAKKAMESLQNDIQIKLLRNSIKSLWRRIESKLRVQMNTSKDKWSLYFYLERTVLDAMMSELIKEGIKFFPEHDGFRTNRPINVEQMQEAVLNKTGFTIRLTSNSYFVNTSARNSETVLQHETA